MAYLYTSSIYAEGQRLIAERGLNYVWLHTQPYAVLVEPGFDPNNLRNDWNKIRPQIALSGRTIDMTTGSVNADDLLYSTTGTESFSGCIIGWCDTPMAYSSFGTDYTVTDGTFTVQWAASGIFTLTAEELEPKLRTWLTFDVPQWDGTVTVPRS